MTDIIERLRIESRREPHEPIWRDAIDEIKALRAEVAEWKRVAAAQAELHGEAEERAEQLAAVLRLALDSHGVLLMTDPMQDAWKVHRVEEIGRALLRDLK